MFLGVDLGTSSVKAVVMDEDGSVKEVASAGYPVESPSPGWAETDPADWWLATRKAVAGLSSSNRKRIQAIGLAGQMHGLVLTRTDGRPLRRAILWADGRSGQELDAYRRLSLRLLNQLGNPLALGMAGPSLLWVKRHEPETYESARWALQPKDWLRMNITSEAYAEPTDASATLLYHLGGDAWANEVLEELDIRPSLLPPLIQSQDVAGRLTAQGAGELGLESGLPVAAGAADAAASLFGEGLMEPGAVLLTIGTGAQFTSLRTRLLPDPDARVLLYRAVEKGTWCSMAAILNAGLTLDWVRNLFQVGWDELYGSAAQVPPGAGGVTFLPHLVPERALRHASDAGACWAGIGLQHGREHLLKAALEGVAFALRDAMDSLQDVDIQAPELRLAGGGSSDTGWRQLLADVLGKPLMAVRGEAGAGRGAALLAGLAAGAYKTVSESPATNLTTEIAAEPGPQAGAYAIVRERYRAAQATV